MALIYVLYNLLDDNSILTAFSEHDLYVLENLYNGIPSHPYRTTGVGTSGTPEWICVDLGTYSGVIRDVTFIGLFNHNLTRLEQPGDMLTLLGGDEVCLGQSAEGDWTHSGLCYTDLTTMACAGMKPIADFKNLCHKVNCSPGYRSWLLQMIDQANPDGYLEIGELVFGQWYEFHRGAPDPNWVRLQPGRADGPMFFMGNQRTYYGQDWTNYYSNAEHFTLTFKNQNDPCFVDEIHAFLMTVQQAGGTFIIVPDDTKPFCYYVLIENLRDYAQRLIYGRERELREWRIELKTLTQGVRLL